MLPEQIKTPVLSLKHVKDVNEIVWNMVEYMDDHCMEELFSGDEKDVDKILNILLEETAQVIHGNNLERIKSEQFGYLEHFTAEVVETLRCQSLNYFIMDVLPEFTLGWHNIEWANLSQIYKFMVILAARDHGKSFFFSFARPLWQLYRYKHGRNVPKELKLAKEGLIVTNERSLSNHFLALIKEEIESNDILRERLYPNSNRGWGGESIKTKIGSSLFVRSATSKLRGRHPTWIGLDDLLNESSLYSQEQRDKYLNIFLAVILPMVEPGGSIHMIGCVDPSTLVVTRNGLERIGDMNPTRDFDKKELIPFKKELFGKDGWSESSYYWKNGRTVVNEITLQCGYQIKCSEIHPLLVMGEKGVSDWKKSNDIKVGDFVIMQRGGFDYEGIEIELDIFSRMFEGSMMKRNSNTKKMHLPEYVDGDLAYLLGLYVAEGYCSVKYSNIEIASVDREVIEFLINNPYNLHFQERLWGVGCGSLQFVMLLDFIGIGNGICNEKKFPEKILTAPKEILIEFLKGMYDGDGSCWVTNKQEIFVSYSTTSENLARTLQIVLLQIFGIKSQLVHIPKGKLKNANFDQYQVTCKNYYGWIFLNNIGFRLKRKMSKIELVDEGRWKKANDNIPHQDVICKELKKTFIAVKPHIYKYNYNQLRGKKTVRDFVEMAKLCGGDANKISTIEDNLRDDRMYMKVKSIVKSEGVTVDFHIPEGHSFITNGIISHNTPFAELDLYGTIRKRREVHDVDPETGKILRSFNFPVFEYPAVFPDGKLLFPQRHKFEPLMEKEGILGSLLFAREYLVKPIADNASIFPYEDCLNNSRKGQDTVDVVANIHSSPRKFVKVGVGVDFAISKTIGADYTVITVGGLDELGIVHVLNSVRLHGAHYAKQIAACKKVNRDFKPDIFFAEDNGMQEIFIQMLKDSNLPVAGKTTTAANKKSLYKGVPRMAALFETGRIKFPYGSRKARDLTDLYHSELNSITFIPDTGKLESTSQHDDTAMSLWNMVRSLIGDDMQFDFNFM